VGTFGSSASRLAEVTAYALICPARIAPMFDATLIR